jgi:hypothetical protein
MDNYQITNNSNEEYLTWIALTPNNDKTNIELVHDFFKKRKCDFNYLELVYEDIIYNKPISIGYTFIKKIMPGEMFSYFIVKTNTNSTFYQDRIVVVKKKEVEQYLRMQIEEKYFFRLASIFLTEN